MKTRTTWLLLAVVAVSLAGAVVLPAELAQPFFVRIPPAEKLGWLTSLTLMALIGLLMWVRWPSLPTGRSLYLAGVLGLASFAFWVAQAKVFSEALALASVMMTVQALLTYPDGKLTRWARSLLTIGWIGVIGGAGTAVVTQDPRPDFCVDCPEQWLLIKDVPALADISFWIAFASVAIVTLAAAALLALRWIRGSTPTRRALSPVVALSVPPVAVRMLVFLWGNSSIFGGPPPWDLWAVSAYLLALYPIGFLWGAYRTKFDVLEAADLLGDLDGRVQLGGVQSLLRERLADPELEIGFWRPENDTYVTPAGAPLVSDNGRVATELRRDAEPFAVVLHDPALDTTTVEAVGSIAGMALENERLHSELQLRLTEVRASRRRIVVAADEARYQVERDLHDGAQQRLVALGLSLELIAHELDGNASPSVSARLTEARTDARTAISELRNLSRGLHPVVLTEAGLGPAIDSLTDRSPVPVAVSVVDGRWSEAIERAVYYVVSESLANIAKHSEASTASVTVSCEEDLVRVQVADDGVGGAETTAGTGLLGITDRVEAIGGHLDVISPAGAGTTVIAVLPCE